MKLTIESSEIEDYLAEIPPIIDFSPPHIQLKIQEIRNKTSIPKEQAKLAFEYCRDEIHHSFDTGFEEVTIYADDVIKQHEGICFSKAHLLATLLRGLKIPTGFCYQRVLRKTNDMDSGYALHGLNAAFLPESGWFRLDPRGNKPGVDSQFCIHEEKLAYPIRENLGEIDYPTVFTKPNSLVIESMRNSKNNQELYFKRPDHLS